METNKQVESNKIFVSIKVKGDKIDITCGHRTLFKEENGCLSCYMPAYDIYFSAPNKEAINKKSSSIIKMYMDHFFLHTPKNGLKSFALQLHKLGFKSNDNDAYVLKQLVNNHAVTSKFNPAGGKSVPHEFLEAQSVNQEATMEVVTA